MISSIIVAGFLLGSLGKDPSQAIPAGIPTSVICEMTDECVPLEDAYTESELKLIYQVVETETHCQSAESKSHVASVIFNMINHPTKRFGKSVKRIITCPNRFCVGRNKITESTREAVKMAYEENTAPGCYALHSNRRHKKRFSGFSYKFSDAAGHHFYGE